MKDGLKIAMGCLMLAGCDVSLTDEAQYQTLDLFRNYMLEEINMVRTNPSHYADLRLNDEHKEGTDNGSYKQLKSMVPIDSISFNFSLNKSALEYVTLLKDSLSHCFGTTAMARAKLAGYTGTIIAENLAGAAPSRFNALINPRGSAVEFLKILIIDAGILDVGHRLVILNPKYKTVGIGFKHDRAGKYVNYVVQLFGT